MALPTIVNRSLAPTPVIPQALSVRFGAETPPTPPSKQQTPEKSGGKSIRQYVEMVIDFFRKCLGFVDGIGEGLGILKHAKSWNKTLENADPETTYYDRTMALLDITYAAFRESVQKTLKQKSDETPGTESTSSFKPNAGNFSLYVSLLDRYPALLKAQKTLPGSFNPVKRAVENQPDWSDDVRKTKLEAIQNTDFSGFTIEQCRTHLDTLFDN